MSRDLTKKQEAFADHYALTRNSAESYRVAGYSTKNAKVVHEEAWKLLQNPRILQRIERRVAETQKVAERKFEVTRDRLIQELAAIAFANPRDYYSWGTRQVTKRRKDGTEYTVEEQYVKLRSSDELDEVQMKAVAGAEMSLSRTGDPVVSLKLSEKRAAIKDLAQLTGHFKEVVKHEGTLTVQSLDEIAEKFSERVGVKERPATTH